MPEFIYQEPFPVGKDTTEYRLLTKDYVKVVECDGRKILKIDPSGEYGIGHEFHLFTFPDYIDLDKKYRAYEASLRAGTPR